MAGDPRRSTPRTDTVLADPRLAALADTLGRDRVKRAVAASLQRVRAGDLPTHRAADDAVLRLARVPGTRAVLNATGVIVHTNLGRAPLSAAARRAVADAAGYLDVEFDLETGRRAPRGRAMLDALRAALPDAEDVHAVNNGAAALVLATTTLARGREVIVSRGEMVEIGDGFRLPDLVESTGARLREVGTTNRVGVDDYAAAIGPDTAAVLKVHPSNFAVQGFTSTVGVAALAGLGVPVIADVGSGLLAPHPGLPDEPDVATALRGGAAVVTCSADKLLGGPQAGLIAGRADTVAALRRHPLARALRIDKLTIAALHASLDGPPTPVAELLEVDLDHLRERCVRLAAATGGEVVPTDAVIGGGGAPGVTLPSWAVALSDDVAPRLRQGDPAVVGRVEQGRCLLDLRCVPEDRDDDLLAAARAALGA